VRGGDRENACASPHVQTPPWSFMVTVWLSAPPH